MSSTRTSLQLRTLFEWMALLAAVLGVLLASMPAHGSDAIRLGPATADAHEDHLALAWPLVDPVEVEGAETDVTGSPEGGSDAIPPARALVPWSYPAILTLPSVPPLVGVHLGRRVEGARSARGPPRFL